MWSGGNQGLGSPASSLQAALYICVAGGGGLLKPLFRVMDGIAIDCQDRRDSGSTS